MIKKARTCHDNQPNVLAKLTPTTMQEQPIADSIIDSLSTRGRVTFSVFTKNFRVQKRAIAKNGINNQKIQFQESFPRIKPVKVGPMAGANIMTNPLTPITVPIFCGGKTCIVTANVSGRISPVPIPWIIRPVNRSGKLGARAEIAAPTIKLMSAKLIIYRVVNLLEIILDNGKIIPMTSIYPVTSHWPVAVVVAKLLTSVGRAMLSEVSLNIPTNAPQQHSGNN